MARTATGHPVASGAMTDAPQPPPGEPYPGSPQPPGPPPYSAPPGPPPGYGPPGYANPSPDFGSPPPGYASPSPGYGNPPPGYGPGGPPDYLQPPGPPTQAGGGWGQTPPTQPFGAPPGYQQGGSPYPAVPAPAAKPNPILTMVRSGQAPVLAGAGIIVATAMYFLGSALIGLSEDSYSQHFVKTRLRHIFSLSDTPVFAVAVLVALILLGTAAGRLEQQVKPLRLVAAVLGALIAFGAFVLLFPDLSGLGQTPAPALGEIIIHLGTLLLGVLVAVVGIGPAHPVDDAAGTP